LQNSLLQFKMDKPTYVLYHTDRYRPHLMYSSGTSVRLPVSVILRNNLFCHREGHSPVAISAYVLLP
jgi:hypothetical protein